jgi:hypothetical protein
MQSAFSAQAISISSSLRTRQGWAGPFPDPESKKIFEKFLQNYQRIVHNLSAKNL